jgi:hypothetical protein
MAKQQGKADKAAEHARQKVARDAEKAIYLSQKGKRKASPALPSSNKGRKRVVAPAASTKAAKPSPAAPAITTRGGRNFTLPVTVWSLSFLNMRWCLTLGEMILPVLH